MSTETGSAEGAAPQQPPVEASQSTETESVDGAASQQPPEEASQSMETESVDGAAPQQPPVEASQSLETGSVDEGTPQLSPAEASRKRIGEAGGRWYKVLNVSILATWEEVKTAHKKLVLMHHPDKGGDADTFKLVHTAYSEAQKKCMKQKVRMSLCSPSKKKGAAKAKSKPAETAEAKAAAAQAREADAAAKAQAREQERAEKAAQAEAQAKAKAEALAAKEAEKAEKAAQAKAKAKAKMEKELEKAAQVGRAKKRARPKPVPVSASRAKLASAMERLEQMDPAKKTMPEDIPMVLPEQVAEWSNAGTCAPIDTREDHEQMDGPPILNAVSLKYSQVADVDLLKDLASTQVAQLHQLQEQGKQLVLFSCKGSTYDKCYLVASYLLDLFGFNPDLIYRMEGGYDAWKSWLEAETGAESNEAEDVEMQSPMEGKAESTPTVEHSTASSPSTPAQAASSSSASPARAAATLRADYILTTARDAHRKALDQLAVAKKELEDHDNLIMRHLQALENGTWTSEADRKAHVDQLWPVLEASGMEASLMDIMADAVTKPVGERGFMDQMAFKELGKRFAERAEKLRGALQVAAEAATKQGKAVQEAQAKATSAPQKSWAQFYELSAQRKKQRLGGSP